MSAPRLEISLDQIQHNAKAMVDCLGLRSITVTAVTKAVLGMPEVARALLDAGVSGLGDARVENLERMRAAGITAPLTLIRAPMMSQVERVVRVADVSLNTEVATIGRLSAVADRLGVVHGVILMVELGDLREGILAEDLPLVAEQVLGLPGIELRGIGTNLACQSGVVPDEAKMAELSALASSLETSLGISLPITSGGTSANLSWALSGADPGRVNDLRLGEAILLGREPLHRREIPNLSTDAITLVAEVIEAKRKPTMPWGDRAQGAFGVVAPTEDRGLAERAILALGVQDVDPASLQPPPGITIVGASSDHLVVESPTPLRVGQMVRFGLGYGALLRAMTSPFVESVVQGHDDHGNR